MVSGSRRIANCYVYGRVEPIHDQQLDMLSDTSRIAHEILVQPKPHGKTPQDGEIPVLIRPVARGLP